MVGRGSLRVSESPEMEVGILYVTRTDERGGPKLHGARVPWLSEVRCRKFLGCRRLVGCGRELVGLPAPPLTAIKFQIIVDVL